VRSRPRALPGAPEQCWEHAAPALVGSKTITFKTKKGAIVEVQRPNMTWYEATHHSFVSRHLANGASFDEVSAVVGHSSPVVTKRFYDRFIHCSFSPRLRTGLGLGKPATGRVVPMPKR